MEKKNTCVCGFILTVAGIVLVLAFDILPITDNRVLLVGLGCFIIGMIIKKIVKVKGCCCTE